ncbi:MAG TPA: prenyltransferase/squalene oxidase repeat-containing protein [Planctomycetaceae bacterium]|nr:prenyltransferase/squalene oxidase repeat-containing protein [Planctomycetaceae bacterium]
MKSFLKEQFVRWWHAPALKALPSYCVSIATHLVALLLLAAIVIRLAPKGGESTPVEVFGSDGPDTSAEPLDNVRLSVDTVEKLPDGAGASQFDAIDVEKALSALPVSVGSVEFKGDFAATVGQRAGFAGELAGRNGSARSQLLSKGGGNSASERCVTNGLNWLVRYQQPDGKWSFRHGPDDPGSLAQCTTGATGLALLSFLGAGHTHRNKNSRYRANVDKGLRYLVSQIKLEGNSGDLRGKVVSNEGMYADAIATLALCEAYVQTGDLELKTHAQQAVNFLVAAQDHRGGGWRYTPHQPGDTTVTGWVLMALKSAKAGHLRIPEHTFPDAKRFLDFVQSDGGSRYGYDNRGATPPMTAIGLLCRMYLGWMRDNQALEQGVEFLSQKGPSSEDIYYDYYATQVLHHWGGSEWKKWNQVLRDHLIETQVKDGDAAGSWKPTGDRGAGAGGRLYQTCLSVMTLEVYYRYLPLYQKELAGRKK